MFVYVWLMCSLVRCLILCCCVPRQKVHTGDVGPSLDSNRIVSPKLQPQARQRLHFLLMFVCLFGVALNLGRSKASEQLLYSTHYVMPSLTKIRQYIFSRTSRKFIVGSILTETYTTLRRAVLVQHSVSCCCCQMTSVPGDT